MPAADTWSVWRTHPGKIHRQPRSRFRGIWIPRFNSRVPDADNLCVGCKTDTKVHETDLAGSLRSCGAVASPGRRETGRSPPV